MVRLMEITTVAHQPAGKREVAGLGDRGHATTARERGKLLTAVGKIRIRAEDEPARLRFMDRREHALELRFGAGFQNDKVQSKAIGGDMKVLQLRGRSRACWIDGYGKHLRPGAHLTHEFQALARDLHAQARYAG